MWTLMLRNHRVFSFRQMLEDQEKPDAAGCYVSCSSGNDEAGGDSCGTGTNIWRDYDRKEESGMEIEKLQAMIEAILFTMGDSVELEKIAAAIGHDEETTRKLFTL